MFGYVILFCLCGGFSYITSQSPTPNTNGILQKQPTVFNLSTYDTNDKTSQVFLKYIEVSNSNCSVNIDVTNAPDSGFFVIQFHSLKADFTLNNAINEAVTGRNTGLVQVNLQQDLKYRYTLSCSQELNNETNVMVMVAIVVYEAEDPVPGGCNLTYQPKISPYQNVTYTGSMVQVDVQPASQYNFPCEENNVTLEMYHLYLTENTLSEKEFFEGITKMLTSNGAITDAKLISYSHGRTYYSAYLGTGVVYSTLVRYQDRTSAYIPTVSYACDTDNWDDTCSTNSTTIWKILIATFLFVGVFMLFAGHICFPVQVFLSGFFFIFVMGHMVSEAPNLALTIFFSIAFGFLWGSLWFRYGVPVISASLTMISVGYIGYCIVLYSSVGDTEYIRINATFWGMLTCAIILLTILMIFVMNFSHILACSVLGATAISLSINHYAGGNLQYIFLNNFRRASVSGFNKAIINPTFQYTDVLVSIMWVVLVISGMIVQIKMNYGRAPFPSIESGNSRTLSRRITLIFRWMDRVSSNERRPLLN